MKVRFSFFPFTPLDYKATQDYLDHKAARGWVLKRLWLGRFAQFEPAQGRRHFVDVCSYASFGPSYDYIQLCSDAGWELVPPTDLHYMVIFRSKPGVDPQPIQSDPAFEWKEFFRKQVLQRLIFAGLYLLLFLAETAALGPSNWTELSFLLKFPLFAVMTAAVLLWHLCHIVSYLSRCRKLGRMAPLRWKTAYTRNTLSLFLLLVLTFLSLIDLINTSALL